jgi:DNA-binding response OmpR family regulator
MQSASLAGRSILVVEDEPLIAMDIEQAFKSAGARVILTRTPRDALSLIEDTLSAVVLDHGLGDGDSSDLCGLLKSRNIPFVLYSGYGQLEGACSDAVLVRKPESPQVLVTTVLGLLQRRPTLHLKM